MTDSLQRFLFEGAPVRGELVHLDATWRAVLERHEYPAPMRLVLGEMMAAAALLSATLKFDGSLILQIQGSGAARLIVVEITSDQTMRATAKWDGELDALSFREMVGDGRFVITIAPREAAQQTYQGIVALEGDSVAQVLEHYMAASEQIDTRLWLAADTTHAAGLMLQRLPGESGGDPDAWNRAVKLGETVTEKELLALPARQVIRRLFHQEDIRWEDLRLAADMDGVVDCIGPRGGQAVRKGDLLARIDVSALRAALKRAEASFKLPAELYQRRQLLFEHKIISKEELDRNVTERALAESNVRQARVEYERGFVKSPINGLVNHLHVDAGEYAGVVEKEVRVVEVPEPVVRRGDVLVRTSHSLSSAGTESALGSAAVGGARTWC